MLPELATREKTEASLDNLPEISEFGDRIGLLLYVPMNDGLAVLMELATVISGDLKRRWQYPTQELDFVNRKGGYNTYRLVSNKFGLGPENVKIHEWTDPIAEPEELPPKVISIKRFRRTRTIWVSARLEVPMELVVSPVRRFFLQQEVPDYCQPIRLKTYESLNNQLLPPYQPRGQMQ